MNKERNDIIDLVKGIAIILVVIGHCIQFGSGKDYFVSGAYYANPIFKFIYSFHMPLFMFISGFLFYYSINRNTWKIIKGKCIGVIIPLISWHTIFLIYLIIRKEPITTYIFFASYFHTLWFLRALFYCYLFTLLINRLFNDNTLAYLAFFSVTLLIPDRFLPAIIVFTMPYFCLGYLYNKNRRIITSPLQIKYSKLIYLLCCFIFIILLYYYETNYYAYISKTYLFNKEYTCRFMVYVNIYRHIIALFGCYCMIYTIWQINYYIKTTWLYNTILSLSKISLCIYIINHYLNETVLIELPVENINIFIVITETIIVLILSYIVSTLLRKHRILRLLFLGGR